MFSKKFICIIYLFFLLNLLVYSQQKIKDFYLSNYKEGSKDWEVKGKEAIVSDNYVDIDTMEATYQSKNDTVVLTSDKAKINKETMDMYLKKNVALKFLDKEGKVIKITCDGPVEIQYNNGIITLNNNVIVESKDGKLYSDKSIIYLDNTQKKIEKIISEGNVKIEREDNITFCQKATYFENEKKVILEGNPRLYYYPKENENIGN